MSSYEPPLRDMAFVLAEIVGLDRMAALQGREAVAPDLIGAVLDEAGRFAAGVLAPLNHVGDREGVRLENGIVRTPPGFPAAYRAYAEGGWGGLPIAPEHGGQGLPWPLNAAVIEMVQSANLSFGLCPLLSQGAIEALIAHGSPEQRALYLPRLVSGEWTGTMNLTEPDAGSDLARVRTRAERHDSAYRLFGQKIFITWGDHDVADNIVHLVLARTPDAPQGVKGLSLFIAPKFLVGPDGRLGPRNDLRAVSLEHKLGIHGSPTAVMSFGEAEGAVATLVGAENRGLEYMFTMMNNARLAVGLQGVAIAERAYQQARDYARTRIQGRAIDGTGDEAGVPIVRHPDVRRMLLTMRALTEASRALAYLAYLSLDEARTLPTDAEKEAAQARVDLLTPIVKAWSTDIGNEVASLGIQVHGGMGYIEETGAAQHFRDARILPIYEGTNGIQANDLVFRKILRDGGAAARRFIAEMREVAESLASDPGDAIVPIRRGLVAAIPHLERTTDWLLATGRSDPYAAAAGAVPYLRLFGLVACGYVMARSAAAVLRSSSAADAGFRDAKLASARFYAESILPAAAGLVEPVIAGHGALRALTDDMV
jgi:alkylation response protein AidB-like acyl-CoA dehydrogenase